MTTRRRHGPQPVAFALAGGMDLVSAQIQKRPGMPIAALNYEPVASGYRRLRGFERYDGAVQPSQAMGYYVIHFTGGDTVLDSIVLGSKLSCTNSPISRSHALGPVVVTSGTTAGGNAAGYVGVIPTDTSFAPTGLLRFFGGASSTATITSYVHNEAVSEAAGGAWNAAAIAARRSAILAVPGAGPIRGVFASRGTNGSGTSANLVYAIRDDSLTPTKGVLYSTVYTPAAFTTWQAVSLSKVFTFNSGGTFEPVSGNNVVGDTSGATGTFFSATLSGGSWAAGTAAGSIVIGRIGGTFQSGENLSIRDDTGTNHANDLTFTNAGANTDLAPGGSYEFISHNFYGASNLTRAYGVGGVDQAFEFDPVTNVLSKISTGMTTDTPTHLAEHQGSLFLSFPGGSLQFSSVGNPLSFDPIVGGAGEIGVGSDITALIPANKSTLGILAADSISVLYGHDSSEYQLEFLTTEAGAIAHSAQRIGQVVYLDNEGIRSLSASATYGNFSFGSLSQLIAPFLEDKRVGGISPAASFIRREKGQYWLIFTDGTGIVGFFGRKVPEWLPFNLGITVTCACSVEVSGNERIFLGASDGYVYELDVGTSFDGAVIEHYIRLPFNNFGSPQIEKRAHKVILDIEVPVAATLSVSVDFDYGSVVGLAAQTLSLTVGGSAMTLGTGESYYASQIESLGEVYIDGVARSFSLKIAGSTSTESPHTLSAVTYLISARGLAR